MDPNALLDAIEDMLRERDVTEAPAEARDKEREAALMCRDLRNWIARGGFEPDWTRYADGATFYHRFF